MATMEIGSGGAVVVVVVEGGVCASFLSSTIKTNSLEKREKIRVENLPV